VALDQQPTRSPREWPKQWVRDESWWRDVSSRTAAGGAVALIVAVVTLVIRYGFRPGVWPVLLVVLLSLVGLVVLIALVKRVRQRLRAGRHSRRRYDGRRYDGRRHRRSRGLRPAALYLAIAAASAMLVSILTANPPPK
jgi:hypothetical protein